MFLSFLSFSSMISESRRVENTLRLSNTFNRPTFLESDGGFDSLTRGMTSQPCQVLDENINAEIKSFLFRKEKTFGDDLKARDIQRERDHGIAYYNDVREFCGLKRARRWSDYSDFIRPRVNINCFHVIFSQDNKRVRKLL